MRLVVSFKYIPTQFKPPFGFPLFPPFQSVRPFIHLSIHPFVRPSVHSSDPIEFIESYGIVESKSSGKTSFLLPLNVERCQSIDDVDVVVVAVAVVKNQLELNFNVNSLFIACHKLLMLLVALLLL